MIAKSEGASPYSPEHYISDLVAYLTADKVDPDPSLLRETLISKAFHYFAEEAAFEVLQKSLDTPPHQRDREHFDATNNRVRSVRAEIEKMRRRIIKLTEQQ